MGATRSRVGMVAAAVSLTLVAAACGGGRGGGGSGGGAEDKNAPIRIALVTPHTGTYAQYGEFHRAAVRYAADEANANGGIDGRKVEVFSADNLGTPEGSVAAAQRLVQRNNATFILGTIATPTTLAVMQRLASLDAVQFGTQSQGDDLTGKSCNARFFRTNTSDAMMIGGLAEWVKNRPERNWDSIAADYTYGRGSVAGLKKALAQQGGRLDKELYAPLGTTDFGSYIGSLNGGDGLFVAESGNDAVNFYKQALQFGLLKKYRTGISNAGINSPTLAAVGDGLVGQWATPNWTSTVDTPQSKAFVAAYRNKTGQTPADYVGHAYVGMQTLFAGVRQAGSVEPAKVAKALEGLTFETLQGRVTMRAADHQLLVPTYVGQVEKTGGGLVIQVKTVVPAAQTTPTANPDCTLGSR